MRARIAVLVVVFLAVVPALSLAPVRVPVPFGSPLDATAISQRIGPSVAYITTDGGSGSGILLADGYVVTNAHVVDPFVAVDLVFPNGRSFASVDVVGVDLASDIAVIGPLRAKGLQPLVMSAADDLVQGEPLFLVGYPGEVEDRPHATISRGILSRFRRVPEFDQTYLQTDAAISGGQSGGALVDGRGRVVGVSGLAFTEAFALALSGADVHESIERILAGEGDEYHTFPDVEGEDSGVVDVGPLDEAVFLLATGDESEDVTVELEPTDADGAADLFLTAYGLDAEVDVGFDNPPNELSFTAPPNAHIYLYVYSDSDDPLPAFRYTSTVPLQLSEDPDGDRAVQRGDEVRGTVDSIDRSDTFHIDLEQGEEIHLFVGSPHADMDFDVVGPQRSSLLVFAEPADSGLYGEDAEATFTADVTGSYRVVVRSLDVATGYLLRVS